MTAPRTRLAEGTTDFERDLLRSWEGEQPSEKARQRALALVGAGTAVSVAASTASAASGGIAGGTGAATASIAPKAMSAGVLVAGKWLAAGAVVVGVAGATVHYARSPSHPIVPNVMQTAPTTAPSAPSLRGGPIPAPPQPPAPTTSDVAPPSLRTDTADARTTPRGIAASRPAPLPSALLAQAAQTSPEPPGAAPRPMLGLGEQVAAIDRARAALSAGDAAQALQTLDDYERLFPKGILAQEATALRIEALMKQGNRDAATELADRLLASHPTSPHAARIRLLLGRAANP